MIQGRERCKTTIVRVIHEARMCMYELGRRMVGDRMVRRRSTTSRRSPTPNSMAPSRTQARWQKSLRSRRTLFDQFAALREPFVFDGRPPPPDRWARRDQRHVAPVGADTTLSGLPGCPGEATGHARIVLDLFDPTRLRPGDVLDRAERRRVLDSSVRAGERRGRRCRRHHVSRRHRQPGARDPVRRLRHRRHEEDRRWRARASGRPTRNGHDPVRPARGLIVRRPRW